MSNYFFEDVGEYRFYSSSRQAAQKRNGKNRYERIKEARKLGTHTKEEWNILLKLCGNRCVFCGISDFETPEGILTKDHVIPIYQGGSDLIENIQPACSSCNSAKGPDDTDLVEWEIRSWMKICKEVALKI